jgi:hypothetical protein
MQTTIPHFGTVSVFDLIDSFVDIGSTEWVYRQDVEDDTERREVLSSEAENVFDIWQQVSPLVDVALDPRTHFVLLHVIHEGLKAYKERFRLARPELLEPNVQAITKVIDALDALSPTVDGIKK